MKEQSKVPAIRMRECNQAPVNERGDFILYWMIAFRRVESNFSLQRAIEWAVELQKPLVIFEALRIGYRWASDRIHRFVIDGMADNAARIAAKRNPGILYYPYVEPSVDAGKGLLAAFSHHACVVVTDDFPCFFVPRIVSTVAPRLPVRLEQVDSNGLLPLRATDRVFTTAHSFRAWLQKELPDHLAVFPRSDPLARVKLPSIQSLPSEITRRWPPVASGLLNGDTNELARLEIDHSVCALDYRGGAREAHRRLKKFLDRHLDHYSEIANQPDEDARSGLSPYLHFGHISAHSLFEQLMRKEEWGPANLSKKTGGRREGWWNVSRGAESWLDEFITWREIGYNMSSKCSNYDQFDSLPDWARTTLEKHSRDKRAWTYSLDEFTNARTHDELWNAAQIQLVREGRIHNYLRMLWGKKILEWTSTPRDALEVMIELNNRFAIDGRNPNSYSGIFWVLGRYDRPWGPERPVFGKVRYMSSDNTRKKLHVRKYLETYASPDAHH